MMNINSQTSIALKILIAFEAIRMMCVSLIELLKTQSLISEYPSWIVYVLFFLVVAISAWLFRKIIVSTPSYVVLIGGFLISVLVCSGINFLIGIKMAELEDVGYRVELDTFFSNQELLYFISFCVFYLISLKLIKGNAPKAD